jgi:N6-L-threonylcarbamoyladenine synthase/protein kinase Bud32
VTERALAYAGKDEVLLVGGVGLNRRLQTMLTEMCEDRGATFHVPERLYLGDNGAMIAYTGRMMLQHGNVLPIETSQIDPSFRADDVDVNWREEPVTHANPSTGTVARGAEAVVELDGETAAKRRCSKRYREKALDARLIAERTRAEARLVALARRHGVPTPVIKDVTADTIVMERIKGTDLKYALTTTSVAEAGRMVGRMHQAGIIHGDLTTSNMILRDEQCAVIDFGLASVSSELEARGVDVHVFFQTLKSTRADYPVLRDAFVEGYASEFAGASEVLAREQEIERRGRYL